MAYPGGSSGPSTVRFTSLPLVTTLCKVPEYLKALICADQLFKGKEPQIVVSVSRADKSKGDFECLHQLLNYEIVEGGNSYPLEEPLRMQQFVDYFLSHDCFVLRVVGISFGEDELWMFEGGDTLTQVYPKTASVTSTILKLPKQVVRGPSGSSYSFGSTVVAAVHIKPNYPGRSDHICNGAFLAVPGFRRCGGVSILAQSFPVLAHEIGYVRSVFNLVFTGNDPSLKLWNRMGYTVCGMIPSAGRLRYQSGSTNVYKEDVVGSDASRARRPLKTGEVFSDAVMFTFPVADVDVKATVANRKKMENALGVVPFEVAASQPIFRVGTTIPLKSSY